MAKNNAKFFVDDDYFVSFDTSGINNNIITIGPLKFAKKSTTSIIEGNVSCSFRGEPLVQVAGTSLDESEHENAFAYVTDPDGKTYIKFAVNKLTINNIDSARKTVRGMLVDYELAHLTPAGTCKDPLYEVSTYLSDKTLVSPTVACSLADVCRKIQALQTNFDTNEAGYYEHIVRIALVQK